MPIPTATLVRLKDQHHVLEILIKGISDAQLRKAIITGKWSIFENIVHLATYQHTFLKRMGIILQEHHPTFNRYTAEADPLFHDNLTLGTSAIMQDLALTREGINAMLTSLSDEELKRIGVHPAYGQMTILQWTEFFLLHESHHLFTIFKLGAELKK